MPAFQGWETTEPKPRSSRCTRWRVLQGHEGWSSMRRKALAELKRGSQGQSTGKTGLQAVCCVSAVGVGGGRVQEAR